MEESAPVQESAPVETQAAPIESSSPAPTPSSLLGGVPSEVAPVETAPVGEVPAIGANETPIQQSQSTEPWHSKLGDSYKDNPNFTKYNSEADFMDGHLNLVKKIGAKAIEMPDENASTEDWNAFYSKTGRPESVDKYSDYQQNITVDDAGNEVGHFEFDKEGLDFAKKQFFSDGMSDKQVQGAMKVFADINTKAQVQLHKDMAQEAQHTEATLRKAYGPEFDAKMRSFNAVAVSLGIKDDITAMGLGNNLNMIRALDTITQKIGESKLTGDVTPSAGGYDSQMSAIKNSPGYRDKGHPNYNSLQNQRNVLNKAKYG